MRTEKASLTAQLHRRESNYIQALQGEFSAERERLKQLADEAQRVTAKSSTESSLAVRRMEAAEQRMEIAERDASETRAHLLTARLQSEAETMRANSAESIATTMDVNIRELKAKLGRTVKMVDYRDGKIEDFKTAAVKASQEADTAVQKADAMALEASKLSDERLATIRRLAGRVGGRPVINRTNDEIAELNGKARLQRSSRMTGRMLSAIGIKGEEGAISEDALMDALVEGGWMETVWESKEMWDLRMEWTHELNEVLRLEWTPQLTSKIRDKCLVSYDMVDQLRFMLSHYRVGKQLRPRPWLINPWNGKRVNFPQPIAPRCGPGGWARLVKLMQEQWGLRMDATGRVAQRSFSKTVSAQVGRDEGRGLLRPLTVEDPLVVVLGADGTGVGKRSITHVATSIAPSYKDGALATSAPPLPSPPLPPLVGSSHM